MRNVLVGVPRDGRRRDPHQLAQPGGAPVQSQLDVLADMLGRPFLKVEAMPRVAVDTRWPSPTSSWATGRISGRPTPLERLDEKRKGRTDDSASLPPRCVAPPPHR